MPNASDEAVIKDVLDMIESKQQPIEYGPYRVSDNVVERLLAECAAGLFRDDDDSEDMQ